MATKTQAPTVKSHVLDLIGNAKSWIRSAERDVRDRHDRIDALDSLDMAARKIEQAQAVLRETRP